MGSPNEPGPRLPGRPRPPPIPRPASGSRLPVPRPRAEAPRTDVEPAVLLVGAGAAIQAALTQALARHGMFVETATAESVLEAVVVAAPDLILLLGDAAKDCGRAILAVLATSPLSSVVPVVILDDNAALDARLHAFRHGAAAVIPNSASADAIADQVARLAREIPERAGESLGNVGEATLQDLVTALGKELRSGVLSVRGEEAPDEQAVRLVLGGGRPLAEVIDEFVTRIRRHIVLAEPLRYEFDERAGGTVQLLGADTVVPPPAEREVHGLRVLLADDDAARADAMAQELRSREMTVVVSDLEPTELRLARLRQIDPTVLLIGEAQIQGPGYEFVRRMRKDTRLRWASLLVVRWSEVWPEGSNVPAVAPVLGSLATLAEPERTLAERAARGETFDTRLEATGPARLLRALSSCSHPLRVTVQNPRVLVEVDLSDELIVCASGQTLSETPESLEGAVALAALMVLSSGRVHIQPIAQATTANLMATIDVAFNMADGEPAPIAPSLLVPFDSRPPSHPAPSTEAGLVAPVAGQTPDGARAPLGPPELLEPEADRTDLSPPVRRRRLAAVGALFVLLGVMAIGGFATMRALKRHSSAPLRARPTPSAALPAPAIKSAAAEPSAQSAGSRSAEAPKPSASAAATAPAPSSSAASTVKFAPFVVREPQHRAPSCAQLLHKVHFPATRLRGAAYTALRHARRELVLGDLNAAQTAYCTAVTLDDKSMPVAIGLARLMLMRRDAHAAQLWAKRALELEPGDPGARGVLGDGLALAGKYEKARAEWLAARHFNPKDPKAVLNLAMQDLSIGDRSINARGYAQAERYYRRSAILAPDNVQAIGSLVHVLLLENQSNAALAWARRALKLAPHNADVQVLWGDVLKKKGNRRGAKAAWKKALRLDPTNMAAEQRLKKLRSK